MADVHLGLDVANPQDRERRFVEFLRSIDVQRTSALYLLGDIFDFWYEYHDVVPKGYARIFAALQDMIEAGVKVYFCPGNHDVWTYHYFEQLGLIRISQPHVFTIGDKTFCVGHGDGLGPVPCAYRFLYAIFHCKLLQCLFSMLHPRIAFALGNSWSKHNRLARHEAYNYKGLEEPLSIFANEFGSQQHIDYFIFGHYHAKVDLPLASGGRLLVLKDWIDTSDYLMYDGGITFSGNSPKSE